jgi:hypothetical protein
MVLALAGVVVFATVVARWWRKRRGRPEAPPRPAVDFGPPSQVIEIRTAHAIVTDKFPAEVMVNPENDE